MASPGLFQALLEVIDTLLCGPLLLLFSRWRTKHGFILLDDLVQVIRVLKVQGVRHHSIKVLTCGILATLRVRFVLCYTVDGNLDTVEASANHLILNLIIGGIIQVHASGKREQLFLLLVHRLSLVFKHQEFVNLTSNYRLGIGCFGINVPWGKFGRRLLQRRDPLSRRLRIDACWIHRCVPSISWG